MTSLRKFSIVLLVVAALAGLMAVPAQAQLTLSCNSTSFPTQMNLGTSYSLNCIVSGGTAPYTYSYTGTIPPGMQTFSTASEYVITGQTALAGSFSFTVMVKDNAGNSQSQAFSVTVGSGGGGSGIIALSSVSPTTLTAGVQSTINLVGANFTGNSIVYVNNVTVATSYQNSSLLIATIPSYLVAGTSLSVYVRDPTNGTSGTLTVSVSSSTSGVTLTSLSPTSVPVNSPGFTLSIFGSGFTQFSSQIVTFGTGYNTNAVWVNANEVTAFIPASQLTTQQTVNVAVAGSSPLSFTIGGGGSTGSLTISCNPSTGPTAIGTSYFQQCSVSGGNGSYTWAVSNLPGGLIQNNTTGSLVTISGTPTGSQSYAYTIQVHDSSGLTGSLTITGTVGSGGTGYSISLLSPQSVAAGSGQTTISVIGNGFNTASAVYFNGSTFLSTSYVSSTQVNAIIPAVYLTSPQTAYITVITSGVTSNSLPFVIGSGSSGGSLSMTCSPGVGPQTVNVAYTATCTASGGTGTYTWPTPVGLPNYLTLSSSTGSSITISGTPPSATPYNYTVRVNDQSSPAQSSGLQFAGQVNTTGSGAGGIVITSLSPSSAPLNSSTVIMTVTGSGFSSNSQVVFDGIPILTTYISSGQLTATVPAQYLTFARPALVTVTTPGVGTSNGLTFLIGNGGGGVQISISCSPGIGPASPNVFYAQTCSVNGGTAPFNWSISSGSLPTGLSLSPQGVTASINGYTTLNGAYSYTVQVTDSSSPNNTATAVFAGVTGTGGGGTGGLTISSISPPSAAIGSPQTTITVTGAGYTTASIVNFNGTPLTTTYVSPNQLNAIIPAGDLASPQTASITVTSSGLTSNSMSFVVGTVTTTGITITCSSTAGPATPSSYSTTCTANGGKAPYNWSISSGFLPTGLVLSFSTSSQVTISGNVSFSGVISALPYNYTLQATDSSTPVQQASYPFVGTVVAGAGSTITSLSPTSAPAGGGAFTLTVIGTGFVPGSTVYFGGTPLSTSYNSANQLSATVPAGSVTTGGTVNITVQTPNTTVSNTVGFFTSGSSLLSVAPTSLTFTYGLGGTLPAAQTLSITSSVAVSGFSVSANGFSNNITWLAAIPSSGAVPGTTSISVAPGALPIGTYAGSVTITGFGLGSGTVVPVTLNVVGPPALVASPNSLTFTVGTGTSAATQTVRITASDGSTVFPYSVSALSNNGGSWLSVTPTTGSTPGTFTVTVNATNLAVATYSGSINVTATGSLPGTLSIPVFVTVTTPNNLSVNPTSLTFNGVTGQSNPANQTIAVTASGSTALNYNVAATTASGGNWLSATASGTTPGSITVSANISNLATGTYQGSLSITATGSTNNPVTVPVTLVVASTASLTSSPSSLTFSYAGGSAPAAQSLNISGPNNGALNFTVAVTTASGGNWLSASPTSGTTPAAVAVSVNTSGLSAGNYTGTVTISSPGTTSTAVQVTLNVTAAAATLSVTPATLTFNVTPGGSAPPSQTVTVSTTNNVTANYTVTATTATGGNWLTATASGTTTGTISVSVNSGNLAIGQYTGSLSIASTGATNTPQTVAVTLNVTNPASIIAAPQTLSFFVPGDGSTPTPQSITVISSGGNTAFTAAAVAQGGNWLTVSGGGQTPGSVLVSVNPAGLFPGQTYNGVVTITAPASNPSSLQVPVTLTLAPQGSVPLQAAPQSLYLNYTQGSGTDLQHIVVLNNGGGSVNYTVQGGPSGPGAQACGNWLNVITTSGTATASSPGVVAIAVNPSGLNPQTCTGVVVINNGSGGQTAVPVYMAISGGTQSILLSQTAMNFAATASGSAPAAQTFQILNPGSGTMQWNISASTLSGGSWLSVAPNSGTAQSLSQPGSPINVTVNPQGLAAGVYYGTVQVTSSGIPNSPQSITVSLTVLASGTNPPAQISPGAVILTGVNGNAGTQTVNVTNAGSSVLSYSTILSTDDGQSWLAVSPASGSIAAGSTNAVNLSASLTGLGTGLRHGTLRFVFSDGTIQTVDVQLALAGASSGTGVHSCGATDLALEVQSPAQGFQASAQVAVPLKVLVQDCAGNALTSSNTGVDILVGSSTTDIRLNYSGNGVWTGTWTPSTASPLASLTGRAIEIVGSGNASGVVTVNGTTAPPPPNAAPYVSAVVNAGSFLFPGLIAPGTMVSIFGSGLADGQVQVSSTPFPNSLQGAQFNVRGLPIPLFFASPGQVNAVIPIGLSADVRDQLIVVRDTTQSAPVDLLVADQAPGVFTVNSQGTGQGAILVGGTSQIAAPAGSIQGVPTGPATAGQTISIFLSGLGVVSNPPADGSPSTGSSLTNVTPVVSIGGVPATVSYSGLAPGEVGLYQVNVVVPPGTQTGNTVPVFISIGSQTANMVTMAIQ